MKWFNLKKSKAQIEPWAEEEEGLLLEIMRFVFKVNSSPIYLFFIGVMIIIRESNGLK